MKKTFIILILIMIAAAIIFLIINKKSVVIDNNSASAPLINATNTASQNPAEQNSPDNLNKDNGPAQTSPAANNFQPPLDRAVERVTKKTFGLYITPKTSPVKPERFQGYHTGTDFETFLDEQNIDVPVHAVCIGNLLMKKYASGYGGVAVQACQLDNQPITVIYGHLNLANISAKVGDNLDVGNIIGNLGAGYSAETSGERKHLHLGFHKGSAINILGYVSSKSELSGWLDPCLYVCGN